MIEVRNLTGGYGTPGQRIRSPLLYPARNHMGGYGALEAVGDVSLTFPDGQITAVIGPNGCGKSTVLKLCCGQLNPSKGSAFIDGRHISSLSRTETARRISLLPQSRAVPDITVERLVLHGRFPWLGYPRVYRAEDKAAAETAMEKTGILDKRKKEVSRLSGGERQKAYLAMLLAQSTGNVLLDEPAAYLDIARQLELLRLLCFLKNEGKAVAVVLHDINAALEWADTVAVMKQGKLLAAGTPKEILSSGAVEKAFGVRVSRREQYVFALE